MVDGCRSSCVERYARSRKTGLRTQQSYTTIIIPDWLQGVHCGYKACTVDKCSQTIHLYTGRQTQTNDIPARNSFPPKAADPSVQTKVFRAYGAVSTHILHWHYITSAQPRIQGWRGGPLPHGPTTTFWGPTNFDNLKTTLPPRLLERKHFSKYIVFVPPGPPTLRCPALCISR